MPTVGQIADKISELKSRIAIAEGLQLYLRANYMSSDAGEPEMTFTRDDWATVPEAHIKTHLADVDEQLNEYREELEAWENFSVPMGDEEPAPRHVPQIKRKKRGTSRRRENQPASEEDAA
jgi:hypothetical protein